LRGVGFDAVAREDIGRWKYAKWIINLGGAAQAMVEDDWQSVADEAQAEGEIVLEAAGVDRITTEELIARAEVVRSDPVDGKPREGGSTWQSHARGRPLESPWLEGAMAKLAEELGVPAPVNAFLARASISPRALTAAEVLGH